MEFFTWEYILTIFITFITVIDPLGIIPVYLPILEHYEKKERRKIVIMSTLIGLLVGTIFLVAGKYIFSYLGISIDAMYIAGGVLLFVVGLEMMYAKPKSGKGAEELREYGTPQEVSVFPLAFPLIAGPGLIATVIMFTSKHNSWQNSVLVFLIMASCLLITGIIMSFADRLLKIFGKTGLSIIDRLVGVLLAALAVQFIINAVKNIVHSF